MCPHLHSHQYRRYQACGHHHTHRAPRPPLGSAGQEVAHSILKYDSIEQRTRPDQNTQNQQGHPGARPHKSGRPTLIPGKQCWRAGCCHETQGKQTCETGAGPRLTQGERSDCCDQEHTRPRHDGKGCEPSAKCSRRGQSAGNAQHHLPPRCQRITRWDTGIGKQNAPVFPPCAVSLAPPEEETRCCKQQRGDQHKRQNPGEHGQRLTPASDDDQPDHPKDDSGE